MVRLSGKEQQILDGGCGRLQQVAMNNIVRYAEILGAEELCEVTKATVFCGSHSYLEVCNSQDFHEVFSQMNLAVEETVRFEATAASCYTQSCVAPCDQYRYADLGQQQDFFQRNSYFLDEARKAGVIIAGTCAPYLTGWLPVRNEHFVTTESGVTMIGNSLWGARGNADGIEAAFWSAICGRTPKWGKHLKVNRGGTGVVQVEAQLSSILDWDLLGNAIGGQLRPGAVPVITGSLGRPDFNRLRQFCTGLAITSNCEMCHIVGLTPEARTLEEAMPGGSTTDRLMIDDHSLGEAYANTCAEQDGPVSLVSLGCPHYDIDQIKRVAMALDGKKISNNVHFMVWTVYPIKYMADLNGYTAIIERAGGHIYTSTCPTTIGSCLLGEHGAMVFDSVKQAASVRSCVDGRVYVGETGQCIEAAISGRWQEARRWRSRT